MRFYYTGNKEKFLLPILTPKMGDGGKGVFLEIVCFLSDLSGEFELLSNFSLCLLYGIRKDTKHEKSSRPAGAEKFIDCCPKGFTAGTSEPQNPMWKGAIPYGIPPVGRYK